MGYDPKCYDLAALYVADLNTNMGPLPIDVAEAATRRVAQAIQDAIEDAVSSEESAILDRARKSQT